MYDFVDYDPALHRALDSVRTGESRLNTWALELLAQLDELEALEAALA